jgi:hypothetical protein
VKGPASVWNSVEIPPWARRMAEWQPAPTAGTSSLRSAYSGRLACQRAGPSPLQQLRPENDALLWMLTSFLARVTASPLFQRSSDSLGAGVARQGRHHSHVARCSRSRHTDFGRVNGVSGARISRCVAQQSDGAERAAWGAVKRPYARFVSTSTNPAAGQQCGQLETTPAGRRRWS